jgi:hypothetical protein
MCSVRTIGGTKETKAASTTAATRLPITPSTPQAWKRVCGNDALPNPQKIFAPASFAVSCLPPVTNHRSRTTATKCHTLPRRLVSNSLETNKTCPTKCHKNSPPRAQSQRQMRIKIERAASIEGTAESHCQPSSLPVIPSPNRDCDSAARDLLFAFARIKPTHDNSRQLAVDKQRRRVYSRTLTARVSAAGEEYSG